MIPLSVDPVVTMGTSPVGAGIEAIVVVGAAVVVVVVVVITSSHLSPVQPVCKMKKITLQRLVFACWQVARKLTSLMNKLTYWSTS